MEGQGGVGQGRGRWGCFVRKPPPLSALPLFHREGGGSHMTISSAVSVLARCTQGLQCNHVRVPEHLRVRAAVPQALLFHTFPNTALPHP